MSDEHVRIIEVSGHKFEVDLRTAKKVDQFKVGDRVKVLVKQYGDNYRTYPGVIVGIDAFKALPTIVIAYIEALANDGEIKFAYLNAKSEGIEICPMCEDDILPTRQTIAMKFDKAIAAKQREIDDIASRKEFFLRQYGTSFAINAESLRAEPTSLPARYFFRYADLLPDHLNPYSEPEVSM